MHSVKWAGLVDEYYSAREKRIAAQTNWDKVVTSIINYEKQNKEDGPFRDYEAISKELKKERDAFLKAQTEAKMYCIGRWHLHPICQPAVCRTTRSLGEDRQAEGCQWLDGPLWSQAQQETRKDI